MKLKEKYRNLTATTIAVLLSALVTILVAVYLDIKFTFILYVAAAAFLFVIGIVDLFSNGQKSGILWYILKWVSFIPIINLAVILWYPVINIVNKFEWER